MGQCKIEVRCTPKCKGYDQTGGDYEFKSDLPPARYPARPDPQNLELSSWMQEPAERERPEQGPNKIPLVPPFKQKDASEELKENCPKETSKAKSVLANTLTDSKEQQMKKWIPIKLQKKEQKRIEKALEETKEQVQMEEDIISQKPTYKRIRRIKVSDLPPMDPGTKLEAKYKTV